MNCSNLLQLYLPKGNAYFQHHWTLLLNCFQNISSHHNDISSLHKEVYSFLDTSVTSTVRLFHSTPFPSLLRPQETQTSTSNHAQMKEVTKYKASKLIPIKYMRITGVPELLQHT